MWHRRWSGIIAIAAQRALACSLLNFPEVHGAGSNIPCVDDILAESRYEVEVAHSSETEVTSVNAVSDVVEVAREVVHRSVDV